MRTCFAIVAAALAVCAAEAVSSPNSTAAKPAQAMAGTATKASAKSAEKPTAKNPTSVVRANPQGKLVRTVVAPAGLARPKPVRGGLAMTTDGEFDLMVEEISAQNGVDPLLVHAVIRVESNYNQFALSEKGAQGYMQLIPKTAAEMGVDRAFSARQNLEGGIKYLKTLLDQYPDLRLVLAAYNAGPEAVEKYHGVPPYKETQDYVFQVSAHYNRMWRDKRAAMAARPAEPAVAAATSAGGAAPAPDAKPVTAYTDAEGRLHISTAE